MWNETNRWLNNNWVGPKFMMTKLNTNARNIIFVKRWYLPNELDTYCLFMNSLLCPIRLNCSGKNRILLLLLLIRSKTDEGPTSSSRLDCDMTREKYFPFKTPLRDSNLEYGVSNNKYLGASPHSRARFESQIHKLWTAKMKYFRVGDSKKKKLGKNRREKWIDENVRNGYTVSANGIKCTLWKLTNNRVTPSVPPLLIHPHLLPLIRHRKNSF